MNNNNNILKYLREILRYDNKFTVTDINTIPFRISIYDPDNLWPLVESGLDSMKNEEIEFALEYYFI